MPPSEPSETGSESGKRSDDRGGAVRGTRAGEWSPHKGGASTPLADPGSLGAAGGITRTGSLAGINHETSLEGARLNTNSFPGAASAPGAGV